MDTFTVPRPLSQEDAEIIRAYEKVLAKYALTETVWCNVCEPPANGTRFHVSDTAIKVECRCSLHTYNGTTY